MFRFTIHKYFVRINSLLKIVFPYSFRLNITQKSFLPEQDHKTISYALRLQKKSPKNTTQVRNE